MQVRIFGPNLNNQSKGQFHVHAAACADCKFYGPGTKYGGQHDEPVIDVASCEDATAYVYDPGDFDYGPDEIEYYMQDLWFAPCVSALPTSKDA